MLPDFVCFYNDIGRPYLHLIEQMTKSAKAVMPESRTVLLTSTPSKALCKLFDTYAVFEGEATDKSLCFDKARAIISWQVKADRPCIYTDPDIVFRRTIEFPPTDIGLLFRKKTAHPINSGLILARPGGEPFWRAYGNTVASLPRSLRAWYADQIALSVIIGSLHSPGDVVMAHGSTISLMDWSMVCCSEEHANESTPAIHYKGTRKGQEFAPYFTASNPA